MADESDYTESEAAFVPEASDNEAAATRSRRRASLYDVVAGRVGRNGFFTREEQQLSNMAPVGPEEHLLRHGRVPVKALLEVRDPGADLAAADQLPDSDMLKAIHTYASDFYSAATSNSGAYDFRSLDETALIATGILLEEAVKEALGENGDMVFVEPEGLEKGLGETKMTQHQIRGRVKPRTKGERLELSGDEDQDQESRAKRRRR
ncbi:hypothetical protein PV08_04747 [Exophiala spinifera]|uniref:Uncharacterized protein n=1 Tax=Exophiala spinifera TaxID=91928 RepID=A0A0D2BF19_9EURO|nr:uncharacterized protein PV08_04747 [Exophiala spinifera]KIW17553.1 hypothetical protein PV08_04747 [Exophiala spinifera]